MESLRVVATDAALSQTPCCRCSESNGRWDRIAGKPYCPNCQESLALGEASPLVERTQRRPCAACHNAGTVCYATFPLDRPELIEMDLCAEHLRDLIGRRLGPHAFHQLRRQLRRMGLEVEEIFLLHDAFYDPSGRALQPAVIPD